MGKIFNGLMAGIAALTILSCHPKVITVIKEVPVLRASSIYYQDSVYYFMEKYKDTNKEIASSYYKNGLEQESTNPTKAIYCVKRAITLQPSLDKYRELGSLLFKATQYDEMRELYRLLFMELNDYGGMHFNRKYLFSQPDESLVAEFVTNNLLAFHYAFEDGESQLDEFKSYGIDLKSLQKKVLADNRLKYDTNSVEYKDVLLSFMYDSEAAGYMRTEGVFKTFLNTIKDTSSTFEITKDSVAEFDYSHFKERDEPGPEDIKMANLNCVYLKESNGKDCYIDYNYKRRLKINDTISAVIYAIDSSETACPREMRHIYYRLVTCGKKANIKADMIVANQSGEELSTLKYSHGAMIVSHYKRYWENPYKKTDFNNHIQKIELVAELGYGIQQDGTIKELNGKK